MKAHRHAKRAARRSAAPVPQKDQAADGIDDGPIIHARLDRRDGPSVVYVTASKTFDGPAVYITLTSDSSVTPETPDASPSTDDSNTQNAKTVSVTTTSDKKTSTASPTKETASKRPTSTTSSSTSSTTDSSSTSSTDTSTSESTTLLSGSTSESLSLESTQTSVSSSPSSSLLSSSTATSGADSNASSSTGISGGTSAGIAIGAIALLSVLVGALMWFHRKKKLQKAAAASIMDDRKSPPPFPPGGISMAPTPNEKPHSPFTPPGTSPVISPPFPATGIVIPLRSSESPPRPQTSTSHHVENPFGNPADKADVSIVQMPVLPPLNLSLGAPLRPVEAKPMPVTQIDLESAGGDTSLLHASAVNASGISMLAPTFPSAAKAVPSLQPIAEPISEMPADVPMSVPLAGAGAGIAAGAALGAAAAVISNPAKGAKGAVYRVIMDFAPTMVDELAIRTGQTVRLVHGYDDGWALCEYVDSSRSRGVVPRTCLSEQPLSPRRPGQNAAAGPAARPNPAGPVIANTAQAGPTVSSTGSPPRPPRPDEPRSAATAVNATHGPSMSAYSQSASETVSGQMVKNPFSPTNSQLSSDQSTQALTFPQPPSTSQSIRAVSPASFTVSAGPEPVPVVNGPNGSSKAPQIGAPSLPPLTLDMDLTDEGLLGSTSISLSDDSLKESGFVVAPEGSDGPSRPPAEMSSPPPPPALFSDHPRSLSPGPAKMKSAQLQAGLPASLSAGDKSGLGRQI